MTFVIDAYRIVSHLGGPIFAWYLNHRVKRGNEDPDRLGERWGWSKLERPTRKLLWFHGASVGESLSILPVLEDLLQRRADVHVLVTTGTVTSAKLMAERLPDRAIHQFLPMDRPATVRRFFDHWRPDLSVLVESEIWPNLVMAMPRPALALNARMSKRSFGRWSKLPATAAKLMGRFDLVLAQSESDAARWKALGAGKVRVVGNLKNTAPPLPADPAKLHELRQAVAGRVVWLAASTHAGEEPIIARVHDQVREVVPNLLTIIVPRHPERGPEVVEAVGPRTRGRRSVDPATLKGAQIHVADTLGELGLFYRVAHLAFIGGSLIRHGGQNPLEAARLGVPVLFGPHMFNFDDTVCRLTAAGCALQVSGEAELAAQVLALLTDDKRRQEMGKAGAALAAADKGILKASVDEIVSLIANR
ncbi:MAG: 3-deoxy-D-manno-octulosonic acid transferase [Geminicoccaceae bacterium]